MKMKNLLLAPVLALGISQFASAAAPVPPQDVAKLPNLNGVWLGSDGGKYYIKQIGGEILWYGESLTNPVIWSNVAHGTFDGAKLLLRWSDVPKGTISNAGLLAISYSNDGIPRLTISYKSGGFGGNYLTKQQQQ
jgi:hypothetical protein